MRLLHIRIINTILLAIIIYLKSWTLLPYWAAMTVSLEILNNNKTYLQQRYVTWYNLIFIGYLVLVVWDRTRTYRVDETIEWLFNSLMHILFGVIVCFKISQYLNVFNIKISNKIFYIALIFNTLGIINEFLQNAMCSRDLFTLIPDARKDLVMNVIGTAIFIGFEYFTTPKKRSIEKGFTQ